MHARTTPATTLVQRTHFFRRHGDGIPADNNELRAMWIAMLLRVGVHQQVLVKKGRELLAKAPFKLSLIKLI